MPEIARDAVYSTFRFADPATQASPWNHVSLSVDIYDGVRQVQLFEVKTSQHCKEKRNNRLHAAHRINIGKLEQFLIKT